MEALPVEYKNPDILHVLYCSRDKINAGRELRDRTAQSPMTPERLGQLILATTGSRIQADRATAWAILESTKKRNQQ